MDKKTKRAFDAIYSKAAQNRDRAVKVSISLPSRLLAEIDKAAEQYGMTRSLYITLLMREYLTDETDD